MPKTTPLPANGIRRLVPISQVPTIVGLGFGENDVPVLTLRPQGSRTTTTIPLVDIKPQPPEPTTFTDEELAELVNLQELKRFFMRDITLEPEVWNEIDNLITAYRTKRRAKYLLPPPEIETV